LASLTAEVFNNFDIWLVRNAKIYSEVRADESLSSETRHHILCFAVFCCVVSCCFTVVAFQNMCSSVLRRWDPDRYCLENKNTLALFPVIYG